VTHPRWHSYLARGGLGYVAPERRAWYEPILPATVLRKVLELHRQNEALQAVFSANSGPLADTYGTSFVASWAAYYGEWVPFYEEMSDSYFARWTSGNVETLQDFINRSNTFEERLRATGLHVEAPTREEVERRLTEQEPTSSLPTWGWWLIGLGTVAAVGYGLYALSRVMREGRYIAEGVAGLGAPTRVRDLEGPSTYNLEIEG
jgi:hypothetical protein